MENCNLCDNCLRLTPEDTELFLSLKALRKEIANNTCKPASNIFSDKSLQEMARTRPRDRESFRQISGVGKIKLEKYGPAFLTAIYEYMQERDP